MLTATADAQSQLFHRGGVPPLRFDIGVLLDCDPELQRARLSASNEGQSMVRAELREAWGTRPLPGQSSMWSPERAAN